MDDFRMELDAIDFPFGAFERGDFGRVSMGGNDEDAGQGSDIVGVRHECLGRRTKPGEQRGADLEIGEGVPVFGLRRLFDFPAKGIGQKLRPIADTKDGDTEFEDAGIELLRSGFVY